MCENVWHVRSVFEVYVTAKCIDWIFTESDGEGHERGKVYRG